MKRLIALLVTALWCRWIPPLPRTLWGLLKNLIGCHFEESRMCGTTKNLQFAAKRKRQEFLTPALSLLTIGR
jgi:hypothetical protein